MSKRQLYRLAGIAFVSFTGLAAMFFWVDPTAKPIFYIFIPILLLWIGMNAVLRIILLLVFRKQSRLYNLIAFMIVSLAILLLLLSGIGQLQFVDIALICSLAVVSGFYFYRTWS